MRKQQGQIWICGNKNVYKKTFIRVRKKQCNVSSHMNYLYFAFTGPKYVANIVSLLTFQQVSEILKKLSSFSYTEYLQKAQNFSDQLQPVKYIFSSYFLSSSHSRKNDDVKSLILGVTQKYKIERFLLFLWNLRSDIWPYFLVTKVFTRISI